MPSSSGSESALWRRVAIHTRPYWAHLAGIFLLTVLSVPLALLAPLPLKIAVDSVIGSRPLPGFLEAVLPEFARHSGVAVLGLAVGLLVAIALLNQLLALGSSLLRTYAGEKLILGLRAGIFRHLQQLSLSDHIQKGTSDSVYRIQHDTPVIQYIPIDGVIPVCTASLTAVGMISVIARLDFQLALITLGISPVLLLLSRAYGKRMRRQWREVKEYESSALGVIHEVMGALGVVKAFGQEDRERDRFVRQAADSVQASLRLTLTESRLGLLLSLTTALGAALILLIGVRHVQAGFLTIGELLMVMSYLAQLYEPLRTISRRVADLQSWLASAERAFALLDKAPDVSERPNAKPLLCTKGGLLIHEVSFQYGNEPPVLQDVSFELVRGMRVGIVGATGSGKTTLVSLLTRFYDPTSGQILLDGIDLRDYRLADLRRQFSIVSQEPLLFSVSIAENIAYARPEADYEDIVAAAKAANVHDFIVSLPHSYLTRVGERGMRLSGGERQRIAVARAFLKAAPIVILDEPTSAVDSRTEAAIVEAMERLILGRTTLIIAHRLVTVQRTDCIVVLDKGRVVEKGTHRGLLAAGGAYAKLYTTQQLSERGLYTDSHLSI